MEFRKALFSALLVAPAIATAQGENTSMIDVYYVPKTDLEVTIPGVGSGDDDGDGFGLRGMLRAGPSLVVTGEYQTASYDDSGLDRDEMRLGLGFAAPSGSGGYVEYVNHELSSSGGAAESDGFGLHGRLAGEVAPNFQLYGQLGYLMLEDDFEDVEGLEYSVGAAFGFTPVAGVFVDYHVMDLEGDQSEIGTEYTDIRIGARLRFGG